MQGMYTHFSHAMLCRMLCYVALLGVTSRYDKLYYVILCYIM